MSAVGNTCETDCLPEADECTAAAGGTRAWTTSYLRHAAMVDIACALAAGAAAAQIRFGGERFLPVAYLGFTCALPVLWWASVLLRAATTAGLSGSALMNSAACSTRRSA